MPSLDSIIRSHNASQDAMVAAFESHLREIVMRAQNRTLAALHAKLSMTNGVIDATPANAALLRSVGNRFMDEMNKAGYSRLVNAFLTEFRGTLPYLQETLETLGKQVGQDWGKDLGFTQKDLNLLSALQVNTSQALEDAITSVASTATTRGLFGVAGLKFGTLVETLGEKLNTSIGKARTIADTAMSNYYATASARAFEIIAKDLPEQELKYRYSGPRDALERPFCRHLTTVDKSYTREQIDRMDNGMLPNVWITRGGWSCRHQWTLDVRDLEGPAKVEQAA